MVTATCSTCRFWDRYVDHDEIMRTKGDCRHAPPVVSGAILTAILPGGRIDPVDEIEASIYQATVYPITPENSWCRRHEEHPDAVRARLTAERDEQAEAEHEGRFARAMLPALDTEHPF